MNKTPIAAKDIRKGDLIRFEWSGDLTPARAHEYVSSEDGLQYSVASGQHFLLDRPTPPVTLPTEPGLYADVNGDAWNLDRFGKWSVLTVGGEKWPVSVPGALTPSHFSSVTRLEPVPTTAKRVLDHVERMLTMPGEGTRPDGRFILRRRDIETIAAAFGVTDV